MRSVNSDVAYDYLRRKILSGEFPPGHALMTAVLSAATGMSRTPVRDALRKLEADGLVTIRPRQGASVKKMSVREFRELCDLRLVLETHAAGVAAERRSESELHEIEFALEAMRRLTKGIIEAPQEHPLLGELILEDVRFHVAIMTAADNELLKKEILRLHLINRVIWGPLGSPLHDGAKTVRDERRRAVLAKHDEIFAAIVASDPAEAKRTMEFHLQELIGHYLRVLARAENRLIAQRLTPDELSYNP